MAILAAPEGSIWQLVDGRQRPMMYFGFQVGDLNSTVAEVVAFGASIATEQRRDNAQGLFYPADDPFCLCRDDG